MRIGRGCWDDLSPEQQAQELADAAARGVPATVLAERQKAPRRPPAGPRPKALRRTDNGQLTLLLIPNEFDEGEEDDDPPPD